MQTIRYIFIHNMPGYLPEADPECYETWDDAQRAAIDYLEREADAYDMVDDEGDERLAARCRIEAAELNLLVEVRGIDRNTLGGRQEWGTVIGNVAYSITPDWVEEDDLDEW